MEMLLKEQIDILGLKNTISEVRNSLNRLNGRLDTAKERTNKLVDK